MNMNYCIGEAELKRAEACLAFAQQLGLIASSSFEDLEKGETRKMKREPQQPKKARFFMACGIFPHRLICNMS